MSSKSSKKTARPSGNGGTKHDRTTSRSLTHRSDSKAVVLTERAWKKTYENRNKTKTAA